MAKRSVGRCGYHAVCKQVREILTGISHRIVKVSKRWTVLISCKCREVQEKVIKATSVASLLRKCANWVQVHGPKLNHSGASP